MVIKRPGYSLQAATGAGCAQAGFTFNGQAVFIKNDTIYSDFQPFAAGSSWTSTTAPPKPTAADGPGTTKPGYMVSHGGALYHIGGKNNLDTNISIYKSTDNGASWTTILTTAPFVGADLVFQNCAVSLNGRIYVLLNTRAVWSSADGVSWVNNKTDIVGSGTRAGERLIVHNGILFALLTVNNAAPQIYSSPDGTTWSSVNGGIAGIGNLTRCQYESFLGNQFIIAGLTDATPVRNDVWRSTDNGVTWALLNTAPGFSDRCNTHCFIYGGKIWIVGGATNVAQTTVDDDVWSSTDGSTFTLVTAAGGFTARRSASHAVHNNTMYIGPGLSGGGLAVAELYFAAAGAATSTALTTPTQPCLAMQVVLIPANGAVVAKAFIKSNKDAWVWDGTTVTKVTDADYPATTVYGVAYLDGTVYVMDSKGVIYGSDLLTPLSWNALNFITANAEADAGVAIARQLDNIIAFKETSIEFFYDAANPVGSPLGKVPNALMEVGLASAGSISYSDNTIIFMSQHRQKGRSVMKFEGTTPKVVSNPWIDRILDGDDLATIYSFVIRSNGHVFYFLTLKSSAITLVYDDVMGDWATATKLNAFSAATVTSLVVQSDGSILATMPLAHGQSDGDVVVIAGASPSAANGTFNLRYDTAIHSALQFSYVPDTAVAGSITGSITAVFYYSTQFPAVYYARGTNTDLMLDETNGNVYNVDTDTYQDNGAPIDVHIISEREDNNQLAPKAWNEIAIVGDKQAGKLLVRYSDDDYTTFSKYRSVNLALKRPRLTQLGSAERRSFELRYTGNTPLRIKALEADLDGWNR